MLDLMFAAALSGMRAGEAVDQQIAPVDYKLVPQARNKTSERDWRTWVGSDFQSFQDQRDCPMFFQKDLPGFGALTVRSQCVDNGED
jgi:hypothetical protein